MVVKDKQIILRIWRGNLEMGARGAGTQAGSTSCRALRATVRKWRRVLQTIGATGHPMRLDRHLEHCCAEEPSAAMSVFYGGANQGGSHETHVAIENFTCGWWI